MRSDDEIQKSISDGILEIVKMSMMKNKTPSEYDIGKAIEEYFKEHPVLQEDTISISWIDGGYINYSSGEQYPEDGSSYTDFVEIKSPKLVFENTMTIDNEYNVFYDENKNFLSSFSNATGIVEVPAGAKYFRLSKYTTATLTVKLDYDYATKEYVDEKARTENPVFTGTFSQNRKEGSAIGNYSHAEGYNTIGSGNFSHVEGYQNTASGDTSHAEGSLSTAAARYTHAEGYHTAANGAYSHSEGCDTTAGGSYSHAEGRKSSSIGDNSHAEGYGTTANGMYSHSEGCNTFAGGNMSFAGGNRTKTTIASQFAVGYGNDPQTDSIFEVGNGLDADGNPNNTTYSEPVTRQNAFRVTQSGVAVAQTGLQIGNTIITENQLISLIELLN